jgi:hypothetical protein
MDTGACIEEALARWIALGVTSSRHPILNRALADCFHPLGIEADWLEAEPFGGLETGALECWLRNPRWNPARIDPAHPGFPDLQAWVGRAEQTRVDAAGALRFPEGSDDPDPWPAVRHSVRAAADATAFIHAAAALVLVEPAAAACFAAGDDAAFVDRVRHRLNATPGAAPTTVERRTADGTASPGPARTTAALR